MIGVRTPVRVAGNVSRQAGIAGVFRAEMLKLTKRPATRVLGLVALAYLLLFFYVFPYGHYLSALAGELTSDVPPVPEWLVYPLLPGEVVRTVVVQFPYVLGQIGLVFAAVVAAGEYKAGTLKTILTQRVSRVQFCAGQLVALGALALVYVLGLFAAGYAAAGVVAHLADVSTALPSPDAGGPASAPVIGELARGVGVAWLIVATWTAFGYMLGHVLRSAALAAGAGLVWIVFVEGTTMNFSYQVEALAGLVAALPSPSAVGLIITFGNPGFGADSPVIGPTSGSHLPFVLAAYLLLFSAISVMVVRKREVA